MTRKPVVLKFGGESLSDPDLVLGRINEVRRGGTPVVVVVSARAGVTDLLRDVLLKRGPRGDALVEKLRLLHPDLPRTGAPLLRRVRALARASSRFHHPPPPVSDRLLSQGERLAAHWFAAYLVRQGLPAVPVETDHLGLITDNSYGSARVQLRTSQRAVRSGLHRILASGKVPIVTGFFGRSREGRPATLGRGGSDYSATAIGAILDARRVELVKAKVAVSTADPRFVPNARRVARLSYEEAEELAQFGARVLHPIAIEPVASRRVELWVRSLQNGHHVTSIGSRPRSHMRAVTRLGPLRIISIRIPGGRQRQGVLAEIGRRLVAAHVNLDAVVTTEAVIGLLLEPSDARRAWVSLRPFATATGAVLGHPTPVSLVSVVGTGVLHEVDRIPRWVLSSAQGLLATNRSVSIVVPEERVLSAVRTIHRRFVG